MKPNQHTPKLLLALTMLIILILASVFWWFFLNDSTFDKQAPSQPIKVTITKEPGQPANPHNDPTKIDVVVNKKHPLIPIDFVPQLITVDGATLQPEAANAWHNMKTAALADGVNLSTNSSYRSYKTQAATYDHWVVVNGSPSAADQVSARPGYSEHQTGLALDISTNQCTLECFDNSPPYHWLVENGYKFGFIQRYQVGEESVTGYSAENWHWRYVGVDTATDMTNKGIKTLEEYWDISGGDYAS